MLLVTVILGELRPSGRILLTLFEYVLCQSTWPELQAADVAAHAAWIRDSLSSLACQVDCSLFQHMHTRGVHTRSLHDAWMYTCVLANSCTNKTRLHTLQGQTEGGRAIGPVIRSSQIWYHCNQISDAAEYSISGFGQSSVTFVAEKWHGALVPNAITELASCTLRTVENTDTAEEDRLTLDEAHTWCNFMYKQRETDTSDWSCSYCVSFEQLLICFTHCKKKQWKVSLQREASVCNIWCVFTVKWNSKLE